MTSNRGRLNLERLNKAIEIMSREDTCDLMQEYGGPANFAGRISVSPEFKSSGGGINEDGNIVFGEYFDCDAIVEWLSTPDTPDSIKAAISMLVDGSHYCSNKKLAGEIPSLGYVSVDTTYYVHMYFPFWKSWGSEDVVMRLEKLKGETK